MPPLVVVAPPAVEVGLVVVVARPAEGLVDVDVPDLVEAEAVTLVGRVPRSTLDGPGTPLLLATLVSRERSGSSPAPTDVPPGPGFLFGVTRRTDWCVGSVGRRRSRSESDFVPRARRWSLVLSLLVSSLPVGNSRYEVTLHWCCHSSDHRHCSTGHRRSPGPKTRDGRRYPGPDCGFTVRTHLAPYVTVPTRPLDRVSVNSTVRVGQ